MTHSKNHGVKVVIQFEIASRFSGQTVTLRNVTEIHYNYPSASPGSRVAFESDIHGTGITYDVDDILEFETKLEDQEAETF